MADSLQDGRRTGVNPRRLCRSDDLAEGTARGFRFGSGTEQQLVFVVRKNNAFHAYVNACPHIGTPLDGLPDRFLDRDRRYLLCGTHGALFRIEDGFCVYGPCAGKRLTPVAIQVKDGDILMV
jgi:nitrite reductase/ring-hydroxylating ferredoxin subunit